jgi:DNA-binding CsgD family transcriptional regulator
MLENPGQLVMAQWLAVVRLTPREREVATWLASGKTIHEVATILGISPKTAGAHTYNLMAKLDVHNRAGVVRWALDNGLVPLS